jgi:hypothetical protein
LLRIKEEAGAILGRALPDREDKKSDYGIAKQKQQGG